MSKILFMYYYLMNYFCIIGFIYSNAICCGIFIYFFYNIPFSIQMMRFLSEKELDCLFDKNSHGADYTLGFTTSFRKLLSSVEVNYPAKAVH